MARRKFVWPLFVVATAVATGAIWRGSDLGQAAGDLDRQMAAAKREGLPMEWSDLRRLTPAVPDEANAAMLYLPAFERLGEMKKVSDDKTFRAILGGTASPMESATAYAALTAGTPVLDGIKAGSRRKGFWMDRDWERGPSLLFPEYSYAKQASRALLMRAFFADDPASAVDDLRAAARMRAHFGSEPVLIGALVGDSMESDVHRAIRALARRGGAWPAAVVPVLDDLGPIPALRRSLACEVVFNVRIKETLENFSPRDLGLGLGNSWETPLPMRLLSVPAVRDASISRIVAYWRKAWADLPADPTDYRKAQAALRLPDYGGPSYALLQILSPVFDGFASANAQAEANRRLTRAALALWSGKTPKLEADPFGRGPLRLKREGSEWTLYSLGQDEKDDGGRLQTESNGLGYDLVVES